jgi:1-acyl-sn-glycerol-3-phosphate acyltransferase
MRTVDAALRLAAFLTLTIATGLGRLAGGDRARLFRWWGRWMLRLTRARVTVRGPAPQPPFLLIANHLSYFDIALLAAHVDTVFVAKHDVRHWPVIGAICARMDTIFIHRAQRRDLIRVSEQIGAALDRGDGVVIFAEGTSSAGEEVRPLLPSLFEVAVQRQLPVHYAAITYRAPDARHRICWWGDMTFPDHLFRLLQLGGFEASLTFGETPVRGADRKQLAHEVHARISAAFRPVTDR